MNSSSRKLIVVGGMAAVVVAVIFGVRAHHDTLVVQAPLPAPFATPPPPVAQTPDAPAGTAQTPDASAAVANNDSVGTKSADTATPPAVKPRLARDQHLAKANAGQLTPPPATSSSPAADQKVETSTAVAASDTQITTDVKSQLAGDSLSKDGNIGVTTTRGVVVLTGNLPSQDGIDHAKDVAGKVPGVKSVDASALVLASL
jgi:hypothetical protein